MLGNMAPSPYAASRFHFECHTPVLALPTFQTQLTAASTVVEGTGSPFAWLSVSIASSPFSCATHSQPHHLCFCPCSREDPGGRRYHPHRHLVMSATGRCGAILSRSRDLSRRICRSRSRQNHPEGLALPIAWYRVLHEIRAANGMMPIRARDRVQSILSMVCRQRTQTTELYRSVFFCGSFQDLLAYVASDLSKAAWPCKRLSLQGPWPFRPLEGQRRLEGLGPVSAGLTGFVQRVKKNTSVCLERGHPM